MITADGSAFACCRGPRRQMPPSQLVAQEAAKGAVLANERRHLLLRCLFARLPDRASSLPGPAGREEIRRMHLVAHIRRLDHVGITVADLDKRRECPRASNRPPSAWRRRPRLAPDRGKSPWTPKPMRGGQRRRIAMIDGDQQAQRPGRKPGVRSAPRSRSRAGRVVQWQAAAQHPSARPTGVERTHRTRVAARRSSRSAERVVLRAKPHASRCRAPATRPGAGMRSTSRASGPIGVGAWFR